MRISNLTLLVLVPSRRRFRCWIFSSRNPHWLELFRRIQPDVLTTSLMMSIWYILQRENNYVSYGKSFNSAISTIRYVNSLQPMNSAVIVKLQLSLFSSAQSPEFESTVFKVITMK